MELIDQRKGNFFFVLFFGGCHIEEATDYLEAIIINWTKVWRIGEQVPKNYSGAASVEAIKNYFILISLVDILNSPP